MSGADIIYLPPAKWLRRGCSCRRGWLGPESAPAPCPICKPQLVERLARRRGCCTVCGLHLDPVVTAEGFTTHPTCDPDDRGMFGGRA